MITHLLLSLPLRPKLTWLLPTFVGFLISFNVHASPLDLIEAIKAEKIQPVILALSDFNKNARAPLASSGLDQILQKRLGRSAKGMKKTLEKTPPSRQESQPDIELKMMNLNLEATDSFGNTALIIAIEKNLLSVVELLIERGANVNHSNHYGNTPLILALQKKNHKL